MPKTLISKVVITSGESNGVLQWTKSFQVASPIPVRDGYYNSTVEQRYVGWGCWVTTDVNSVSSYHSGAEARAMIRTFNDGADITKTKAPEQTTVRPPFTMPWLFSKYERVV